MSRGSMYIIAGEKGKKSSLDVTLFILWILQKNQEFAMINKYKQPNECDKHTAVAIR